MGLSNQIPSSRLIQPGVIANSGERPASPYEGQVVFQKDTNQTLVWDGSAWVMVHDTDQPPGLQLVKSQEITSSTATVTVTDAFSNDYNAYRILCRNISMATEGGNIYLKLSNSTGSTYGYSGYYNALTNGSVIGANLNNTNLGVLIGFTNTIVSFVIDIFNPNVAGRTTLTVSTTSSLYNGNFFGHDSNAVASPTFTLNSASGNFTGGTIRVYGYRD